MTDQSGQPVTAEEFVEDETDATVVSATIGTAPMKVTLLVDNGGSRATECSTHFVTP